jgi:hypothetical protein
MREQIATLKAKRKEHRAAFEYDEADTVQDEITDLERKLIRAEFEEEKQAERAANFTKLHTEARADVIKQFPDAGKKDSALYAELLRENAFIASTEPEFFENPAFPLELVNRVKTRRPDLFAPVTAAPGSPQNRPGQQTPRQPVGVVAPADAGTAAPITKSTALQSIDAMNADDLDAIIEQMPEGKRRFA